MYDLMCLYCGAVFSADEAIATADWYWDYYGFDPGAYACPFCEADERDIIELY